MISEDQVGRHPVIVTYGGKCGRCRGANVVDICS